jgi:hypothetical protein
MLAYRSAVATLTTVVALGSLAFVRAQSPSQGPLPLEPSKFRGEAVFAAIEGWYRNADGTSTLLLGYYNRNQQQILDIPIGPNNSIEPGGPDQGQPTHFLPRRQWGVFSITVPKDFGQKKLTWTIVANDQKTQVAFWLNPPYILDPFINLANGNTPPKMKFGTGPEIQGPPRGIATTLAGTVNEPVTLKVWAMDKPPTTAPEPSAGGGRGRGRGGEPPAPINITWHKFRGPGEVTFAQPRLPIRTPEGGEAETTAKFSAPGEYWLLATANDNSGDGGGGDQCCWSNAHVKVNIRAAGTAQ